MPGEEVRSEEIASWRLPADAATALPAIPDDPFGRRLATLDTDELGLPRQQFGDTGFRLVAYSPTATGRFADCYSPGTLQAGSGDGTQVRILNSAVPPPLVVRSVVPSQAVLPQTLERSEDAVLVAIDPNAPVPPDAFPPESGWTRRPCATGRWDPGLLGAALVPHGPGRVSRCSLVEPQLLAQSFPGTQDDSWNFDRDNPLPQWCCRSARTRSGRQRGSRR